MSNRWSALAAAALALAMVAGGCGDDGAGAPPDAATTDTGAAPGGLGTPCLQAADCLSGVCLRSEYGPPFCSRACAEGGVTCSSGPDAPEGETLCVSYAEPPFPDTPAFKGEFETFCALRCTDDDVCAAANANWERCDTPSWLGDPLYPGIGQIKVCQAPSYHGKDPVDPTLCDWEKTVTPAFASEANLCRTFCDYLQTCQEIAAAADMLCCQWGCFNRMVLDGERSDPWYDTVKCFVDNHGAFPPVGTKNFCSEPPVNCGGTPRDPTPPAAR